MMLTIVATELPSLFDELRLDAHHRQAVREYAGALASWLTGDLAWYGETRRYTRMAPRSRVMRLG